MGPLLGPWHPARLGRGQVGPSSLFFIFGFIFIFPGWTTFFRRPSTAPAEFLASALPEECLINEFLPVSGPANSPNSYIWLLLASFPLAGFLLAGSLSLPVCDPGFLGCVSLSPVCCSLSQLSSIPSCSICQLCFPVTLLMFISKCQKG